ncbi:MAG: ectoine hydroxylase-related dioxygenase (phytanoyl-CoA dioxygenase family) [Gammaproteobacteria bacterium]|jgi:ectoine hydroxylase-related dioxygenase (phytanoyl-CoA dioxygenase family)
MKPSDQFKPSTVEWRRPELRFDNLSSATFQANSEDIETFQRDGVILLKAQFSDWVDRLRAGLETNLTSPQKFAFPCESNPLGEPGRFFDSYCNWQLIPQYLDFVCQSHAAAMAGQFMQSNKAQFFHEHAFLKSPATQRATPWHQDLPYYCVDGKQSASVYVSLDHADTDVAVQFIKGSHRWNKLFHPRIFENGSNLNDGHNSGMETVPDIDHNRDQYSITNLSLEPGDAVVFDFRTLHGTGDAKVKSMRRAFSTRWLGDDMRYCERPGEVSPPYVDHGMSDGDTMREDWFPVLWKSKIT